MWNKVLLEVLKKHQSERIAQDIMTKIMCYYPGPEYLGRADAKEVAVILAPLPILYKHIRQLIRISSLWHEKELKDLPGVTQSILEKLYEKSCVSG